MDLNNENGSLKIIGDEKNMKPIYIDFQEHGDWRGQLVALEENKNIPFSVKRVYFMYDTLAGVVRGKHAHRQLQQILFCVAGACTISLDNGVEKVEIRLNQPSRGLLIGPGIWREMYDFTENAVLMVLASEYYDESDYIRNYEEFLESIKNEEN